MGTRIFSTYPAKPTFGANSRIQNSQDYTNDKSTQFRFCNVKSCDLSKKTHNIKSQSELIALKKSQHINYYGCFSSFNKTNLNVNLITKLDLKDVCVISDLEGNCPTPIIYTPNTCEATYNNYIIDPSGVLFGNTICGVNNYERFMIYNRPPSCINSSLCAHRNKKLVCFF